MVLIRLAAPLAALALLPFPAWAAAIRGRVDVQLDLPAAEPRPTAGELGMGGPREVPDRRLSVVYLEKAPQGAFEQIEPGRARLVQRGEAFLPHVLAVTTGTTVDFPNDDRTYHNVFSLSKTKRFDLGRYGRGESKAVRFERPGVVRVFCDIHSHMSAFILVFAHRYFAQTGADGAYRIDGVPPGTWSLAVWTDGQVRDTRSVHVPDEDATVDADFVVK